MDRLDGYYINLDRSTGRREALQAELGRAGAPWVQRFAAVDGRQIDVPPAWSLQPSAYACLQSHLAVLELADPLTFTLILEDDIELSDDLIATLHTQQLQAFHGYDIVFLDCQPALDAHLYFPLWRSVMRHMNAYQPGGQPQDRRVRGADLLDAKSVYLWGMTAYLVTPRGKATLRRLLSEPGAQADAIDMLVRNFIQRGEVSAAVLVPFLATPRLAQPSTMEGRPRMDRQVLCDTLRRLLFAGPLGDLASYSAGARQAAAGGDPALKILGDTTPRILRIFR